MAAYQTFLRDCDCERGGILFKDNIPCCRWCRTPYTKGGMINYDDEHFPHSVKAGKGTANDVLNTEETIDDFWKRHNIGVNDNIGRFRESFHSSDKSLNTGKEWEVVEVIEDDFFGRISNHLNHSLELRVKEGHAKIKSVKRLSDNEVFSVGDRTISGEISSFKIGSYGMQVHFRGGTYYYIDKISKLPTPSQPQNNKERIEVELISGNNGKSSTITTVITKKKVPIEKYPEIKTAIEKILNHE